jgi:hypothetical protein
MTKQANTITNPAELSRVAKTYARAYSTNLSAAELLTEAASIFADRIKREDRAASKDEIDFVIAEVTGLCGWSKLSSRATRESEARAVLKNARNFTTVMSKIDGKRPGYSMAIELARKCASASVAEVLAWYKSGKPIGDSATPRAKRARAVKTLTNLCDEKSLPRDFRDALARLLSKYNLAA